MLCYLALCSYIPSLQESDLPRAGLTLIYLYIYDARQNIGHMVSAKEMLLVEQKFSWGSVWWVAEIAYRDTVRFRKTQVQIPTVPHTSYETLDNVT